MSSSGTAPETVAAGWSTHARRGKAGWSRQLKNPSTDGRYNAVVDPK